MSYKDALIVGVIITVALTCTVFMPAHSYDVFAADPSRWSWDFAVFVVTVFITQFGALTGLTAYAKRQEGT